MAIEHCLEPFSCVWVQLRTRESKAAFAERLRDMAGGASKPAPNGCPGSVYMCRALLLLSTSDKWRYHICTCGRYIHPYVRRARWKFHYEDW